jgi:hypothetical protein
VISGIKNKPVVWLIIFFMVSLVILPFGSNSRAEKSVSDSSSQNISLLFQATNNFDLSKKSLEYRQSQYNNIQHEYSRLSWVNFPKKILLLIRYGKNYLAYRNASKQYLFSKKKLEEIVKTIPPDDTTVDYIDFAEEKYDPVPQPPVSGHTNDFRNFYGICWRGDPSDNLLYARQMGYEYVFHQNGMENDPNSSGLQFFIESPELRLSGKPQEINLTKTYSQEDQDYYNQKCCWRSIEPFPMNLVTGWPRNPVQFTVSYDFQQQNVIDYFISLAIEKIRTIESVNPQFRFAGFAWDESNIHGEFWSHPYSRNHSKKGDDRGNKSYPLLSGESPTGNNKFSELFQNRFFSHQFLRNIEYYTYYPWIGPVLHRLLPLINPDVSFHVPLSYWTGEDSSLLHPGITHEFPTYVDGYCAYYKQIVNRVRQEVNPQAKWILEPYFIYNSWLKDAEQRPDEKLLIPNMLCQEGPGTDFVDNLKIFESKLVSKNNVGVTSPNFSGEFINREEAAKAGINGAWFNWYGRFGESQGVAVKPGGMPNYQNVTEVPARHKLIRVIPNWDNLTDVPLSERSWDGSVYKSPNGYASDEIYYSRHPKTRKMFVVFLKKTGKVRLYPGEKVVSVKRANEFFQEAEDARGEVKVSQFSIRTTDQTQMDTGYIITLVK